VKFVDTHTTICKLFIIGFKCVDEASGGRKGKERDSLTTGETDRKRERERKKQRDRQTAKDSERGKEKEREKANK
jgi:hypothetical protein